MNKVQVIINGKKIYERKTPRTYSHAVVAVRFQTMTCDRSGERPVYTMAPVEPTLVISCHRTELLAQKAARGRIIANFLSTNLRTSRWYRLRSSRW